MIEKLIAMATHEQLVEYFLENLDSMDAETKEEIELSLYNKIYGFHFNQDTLEQALTEMENEDGTKGGHWTVEQTDDVAKSLGIPFDGFNRYDWCYVMNMMYSDYYGAVPDNVESYSRLAKKFICDKDAPKGTKAYKYYLAMD